MTTVESLIPVAHKSGPQSRKRSGVERYQIFNRISKGTYGAVYRAWDKEKDELVAIKHEFDGFSRSTERELAVLKSLPRHRNIVNLREVVVDSSRRVLVIMEYFPFDLKRFMDADPNPCAITTVKSFMRQLLQGVEFLHRNGVAHRDLKPTNILVDREGKLKICDFGLSRRLERESGACTPGVVTLWYRAPEVLTGSISYSSAIDMWSVGCIMGELVVKTVLFPGTSEINQLDLIRQFTESPCPGNLLKWLTNTAPLLSKRGFDLLLRLLTWDPDRRITAKEALRHNWFRE